MGKVIKVESCRECKKLEKALWKALGAMNYMGTILNGRDMTTEEDVALLSPCFEAARKALSLPQGTSEKETDYLKKNGYWNETH